MSIKIKRILQKIPNWNKKKYLVAFSGGIDSVVLAQIFIELKLDITLAHCNFKLRKQESDEDQRFVENYANKKQIPLLLNICDLSQSTENTQLAARKARYTWFEELLDKHKFDYLVTAHHLNDSIETFFINLLRTSGLKGLTGIHNTERIIRPMQSTTREEIVNYALANNLQWREDSSNASEKYRRNFIRHQIIPKFKEIKPDFESSMLKTLNFLSQSQDLIEEWFQITAQHIIKHENNSQIIDWEDFKQQKHREIFLYQWLSPYGFSDWTGINHLIDEAQNGKYLIRNNYRLSKNNNRIILEKIPENNNTQTYTVSKNQIIVEKPLPLSIQLFNMEEVKNDYKKASATEAYLDYDLISYPLTIRKWEAGDYFYPLGMKGKKKLSDFFKDSKMSLSEKEKIWLICDAKKNIIWIVGKRIDNRFKVTEKTKQVLHMKLDFSPDSYRD